MQTIHPFALFGHQTNGRPTNTEGLADLADSTLADMPFSISVDEQLNSAPMDSAIQVSIRQEEPIPADAIVPAAAPTDNSDIARFLRASPEIPIVAAVATTSSHGANDKTAPMQSTSSQNVLWPPSPTSAPVSAKAEYPSTLPDVEQLPTVSVEQTHETPLAVPLPSPEPVPRNREFVTIDAEVTSTNPVQPTERATNPINPELPKPSTETALPIQSASRPQTPAIVHLPLGELHLLQQASGEPAKPTDQAQATGVVPPQTFQSPNTKPEAPVIPARKTVLTPQADIPVADAARILPTPKSQLELPQPSQVSVNMPQPQAGLQISPTNHVAPAPSAAPIPPQSKPMPDRDISLPIPPKEQPAVPPTKLPETAQPTTQSIVLPQPPNTPVPLGQISQFAPSPAPILQAEEPGEFPVELALRTEPEFTPREINRTPPDLRLARHVAQQLVEVARALPDRPVELTLNPEELGRVRMTLTASDGTISVALVAERGETAELLRRHIETLGQEFRALGYTDISFSFGGNGPDHQNRNNTATNTASDPPALPDSVTDAPTPMRVSLGSGMDIRL